QRRSHAARSRRPASDRRGLSDSRKRVLQRDQIDARSAARDPDILLAATVKTVALHSREKATAEIAELAEQLLLAVALRSCLPRHAACRFSAVALPSRPKTPQSSRRRDPA